MGVGYVPDEEMLKQLDLLKKRLLFDVVHVAFMLFEASPATKNHIGIDGMELHTGAVITPYLLDADRYVLFIATAGQEFEQFQHEVKSSGDILQEFCLIRQALQLRRQLYASV